MNEQEYSKLLSEMASLIRLNPNKIEFEDVRNALLLNLSKRENIAPFLQADTIMYLVDAIAAVGAYAQYSIDMAWGEGNLTTAKLPSSVRAILRTLGVRQRRKTPASMTVLFTRPFSNEGITIPSFTQFTVGNDFFFSRDDIYFEPGEIQVTATLYEGEIISKEYNGFTEPFTRFKSPENAFAISDNDVRVYFDGKRIEVSKLPLWNYRTIYDENNQVEFRYDIVTDFTTSDGALELLFGSEQFGIQPSTSTVVRVEYAVTRGKAGRSIQVFEQSVSNLDFPTIIGVATTNLSGGDDEISIDTYKRVGPLAFSAQSRAVDEAGYKITSLEFPGVVDAVVTRQAYYAPEDVRYANFVRVSLLTDETLTPTYWNNFNTFLTQKGLKTAKYIRYDPTPITVNVEADVYISNELDPINTRTIIEEALTNLFRAKYGTIGLDIFRSDIIETITNATPGINFVELLNPTIDIITKIQFPELIQATVIDDGTGSLPIGNYQYLATIVTSEGESLPVVMDNDPVGNLIVTNIGGKVSITISEVPFGNSINLYRRLDVGGTTTITKMTGFSVNGFTFVDDGSTGTVVDKVNRIDTSGLFYAVLGTKTLNLKTTNRLQLARRRT